MKNLPKGMSVVASGHTAGDLDRQIYEANAFIDEGIDAYVFIANRFAAQDEDDSVFLRNFDKAVSSIPEIGSAYMNALSLQAPYEARDSARMRPRRQTQIPQGYLLPHR